MVSAQGQGITKFVAGFFRHGTLLLSMFLTVILITLLVTLATHKQYASTMKILVQNSRQIETVSSSKDDTAQQLGSAGNNDTRINSEIELLSDSDLMEHLVLYRNKLTPEEGPAPMSGSKQMARAIGRMLGRFDFQPVKKSDVFTITYVDSSPELARQVLSELERTYIERRVQLSRPTGTFGFFNKEAGSYDKRLTDAEQRLADFQSSNQFVSLEKEKTSLAEDLNALQVTTLTEQAQVAATSSRITAVSEQLRRLAERVTTLITKTPNQQGAQSLIAVLTDLKNRRVHLAGNFHSNDRSIVELDEQIRNTEDALTDLREHDATQTSTDNNPTVLVLQQQMQGLLSDRAGLTESFRAHEAQLDNYRKRLALLQKITPQNNELEREVAETRSMNQSITEKREAARIGDLLDAGQFGNIAVAQQPTFSRQHVKPRLSTNLILGGITGLFLCFATLFLLESTRGTILTPTELDEVTGTPTLAVVADSAALSRLFWHSS